MGSEKLTVAQFEMDFAEQLAAAREALPSGSLARGAFDRVYADITADGFVVPEEVGALFDMAVKEHNAVNGGQQ